MQIQDSCHIDKQTWRHHVETYVLSREVDLALGLPEWHRAPVSAHSGPVECQTNKLSRKIQVIGTEGSLHLRVAESILDV